jgi:UDP-GlcNAc:undecaprenyl-phosphate GlcNAc-1-phosphate transferase
MLAIQLTQTPGASVSPMVPVLVLGVPIIDTIWVMTRRVMNGGSPFAPDRTHVHHKFLDLGFQHRFTVIILYAITLFWSLFAIVFRQLPAWQLLACFLLISLAAYQGLRHVLNHPERFYWLRRDSSRGMRDSLGYQRLAALAARLAQGLTVLIFVYLAIGFLVGIVRSEGGSPWQLTALLLVGAVAILLITRNVTNSFLLAMLYFVGLAVTLEVEAHAGSLLVAGLSLEQITDGLLLLIALLAGVKIMMRQDGEFYLASIDILLLGLSIFLAVALRSFDATGPLAGAFIKGIVLFIGVKVVTVTSHRQSRAIVIGMLVVLGGIIVGGMV